MDIDFKNINKGCNTLSDDQLCTALVFIKKSISGCISPDDYLYLENMRNRLDIKNPADFVNLLSQLELIYYNNYFNRKKN